MISYYLRNKVSAELTMWGCAKKDWLKGIPLNH